MPGTDTLTIAPTLHGISSERVAFVYNSKNAGSLEVAQYYRDKREVPNENLIGLEVPDIVQGSSGLECESAITLEDYTYFFELPLIAALQGLGSTFTSDGDNPIWVIILGYGIPLFYNDGSNDIAIASRLHRLGKDNSTKVLNHTFDRRNFQFFDSDDALEVFITAVLDGPTVAAVKTLIDRGLDVDNQTFITGKVYVDPYGRKVLVDDLSYQQDILDFVSVDVPNLGIDSVVTVDIDDPYQEPTIATLTQDSFYWGWFNPTFSKSLFSNQNERRVFLYNADDRSACNIHFFDVTNDSAFDENGSDHWCNLAINVPAGYATCAGSVGDSEADAYLRPTPFFRSLHQGATVGEAFLFASKFVSWSTVLIGDPLMVVNFPVDLPAGQDTTFALIPNDEVILRIKKDIEASLGWGIRQSRLLKDLKNRVFKSVDLDEELELLHPINAWLSNKNDSSQQDLQYSLVSTWLTYIQQTTNTTLSEWLTSNSERITSSLKSVIDQTGTNPIDDAFIYPEGWWSFEFEYDHPILTLDNIFFHLEVSRSSDFPSNVVDITTRTDVEGWKYEGSPDIFVQLDELGFPSNFSGRRIRFESPSASFLRTTEVYYVRWTPTDINGLPFLVTSTTQTIVIST